MTIKPTNVVELLVDPYGTYEVDATDEETATVYLVDSCGTIICNESQVRKIR